MIKQATSSENKLRDKAREFNRKYTDPQEATDALVAAVKRNDEFVEVVIRYGCNRMIHDARHGERGRTLPTNPPGRATVPRNHGAGKVKAFEPMAESMLEEFISGGINKKLGDCTRVELMQAIADHRASIKGHQKRIAFYEVIASKLKNDTTIVRKAFTARSIQKAYQSC